MTGATVRDAAPGDAADICALNLAAVTHTSPMDQERLALLSGLACYFKVACVAGQVSAFVLAMRDGVAYGNDNYQWFANRTRLVSLQAAAAGRAHSPTQGGDT